MANKNTLRLRRLMESSRKTGAAMVTENNHKWKGEKTSDYDKIVGAIREQTRRLYGRSA